jgi:molybdenum cofactor cytidylyltransferase
MEREGKIACVILAAGMAKRFGSTKQLAKLGKSGKSLVQTAVDVANESKASYVLLVLGHDASEIMAELNLGRAQVILNKEFESGLASSIRTAISNIPSDCVAAIFMVADQPELTHAILNNLITVFRTSHSQGEKHARIFALSASGEPKNPVLIVSELFPLLAELKGDTGARDIIRSRPGEVRLIEVENSSVFTDVDVPPAQKAK